MKSDIFVTYAIDNTTKMSYALDNTSARGVYRL